MKTGHFGTLQWMMPTEPATAAEVANPVALAMRRVGIPKAPGVDGESPVKEARYLLRAAAEVEHGLLVQYLYAGYSAKGGPGGKIVQIAKEEMGHLLCVQNLLVAVGSGPYFDRQDFNASPDPAFPAPYPFILAPLSKGLVTDFVIAESPMREILQDTTGFSEAELAANKDTLQALDVIAPLATLPEEQIHRVGALYAALFWLFKTDEAAPPAEEWAHYPTVLVRSLHQQAGRTNWHLGDGDIVPEAGVKNILTNDTEDWGRGDDRIFARGALYKDGKPDRPYMRQTLSMIAAQGEGWLTQDDSHFQQFLKLFQSFSGANPPSAWNVPTGPVTAPPAGGGDAPGLIDDPESVLWARLFNLRYWIALLKLSLAVASPRSQDNGSSATGRGQLIADAIDTEMMTKLRRLAVDLVKMRRRPGSAPGDAGEKAAPPFELPAGALPDRVPTQWARLRDYLTQSGELIAQIKGRAVDPANPTPRGDLDKILKGDADLLSAIPVPPPT